MKETVFIIWGVLFFLSGLYFTFHLKRRQIKLNAAFALYKLALVFWFAIFGFLFYYLFRTSLHMVWIARLFFFVSGGLYLLVVYSYPWSKRNVFEFSKDSFLSEFILILLSGLLGSITFIGTPRFMKLMDGINLSASKWDLPVVFLGPYLVMKFMDSISQIPFRVIEKQWVYPIEPVNPEKWPWRDLMQVNFNLKKNLFEEYRFLTWNVSPWIEAPREARLGDIFRLLIQERNKNRRLVTIQDMGNEYGNRPRFCWIFKIKFKWWDPRTWFRIKRYLDPDLNLNDNEVRRYDTILARRVPLTDQNPYFSPSSGPQKPFDPEQTVLINR